LKPGDIRRQTAAIVGGIPVGSYYQDQQVFEVTVWGGPALRQNPTNVENIPIFAPDGTQVPLKSVATVSMKPTPAVADHEKASRFVDVTADLRGASANSVVAAVKQRMNSLPLPLGYHTEVASPLGEHQRAFAELALITLAAAIGVYLLLQAALHSWRKAALIVVVLPFAVSGAVIASAAFGWGLTIGAVAGIVPVLGIALRNSTLLVGRFEDAEEPPDAGARMDLIASTTHGAAVPVLMTAVTAAILVIPFAVLGNVTGTEILKPFCVAVIGGLITSTALTLLVLPALYGRWGGASTHGTYVEGAQ
jgi:Cu/Ag efflux pump CusA